MESFQGTLALDWANGQVIASGAGSTTSTAFDANFDRIVFVSTTATVWISVGTAPTAVTGGAGSMPILTTQPAQPIYVPVGMLVAAIGAASVSLIPALIASDP